MKAFIDTSSLVKRYVAESGSDTLDTELNSVSEIIVAPTYWVELHSALQRRLKEKTLSPQQATLIRQEAAKDLNYFGKVLWNDSLEKEAIEWIKKYHLKTLDSVQLASGILAKADLFLTSDQNLYEIARKETNARLI